MGFQRFNSKGMDCNLKNKIVIRIRGGLGNQLFGYAFGKNLSIEKGYDLILDTYNAFEYDKKNYKRSFELNKFNTNFIYANNKYLLYQFEKIQRNFLKIYSIFQIIDKKIYIENFSFGFNKKFEKLKPLPLRFLDGMWQSEKYFHNIKSLLQSEITPKNPLDDLNQTLLNDIRNSNSIAIHVRFFDNINSSEYHNMNSSYYENAINFIKKRTNNPKFYIFSDQPENIKSKIKLNNINYKIIDNNIQSSDNYKDLLLMKECRNFIIANSTFSWWGAWLSSNKDKIVICPKNIIDFKYKVTTWGFKDQIPSRWIKL